MNKKLLVLDNVTSLLLFVLAVLMPIFFLPITVEFFEFNKLALLTIFTIIGLGLWATKVLVNQKVNFAGSSLDLPLIALGVVFVASTFFSIDKTSSVFGNQGRWFPSLFSFLTIVCYYYLLASNLQGIQNAKKLLNGLIVAITLGSVVSVLSYFGIFIGSQSYFQIINFSLTGSMTTTVLLAVLAFVLSTKKLITADSIVARVFSIVCIVINFLILSLTNTMIGWAALVMGLVTLLSVTDIETLKEKKLVFSSLGIVLVVLTAFATIPFTRDLFATKNYPYEVTLPIAESWMVSTSSLRDFPVVGTGPATFYLNFTRYKSLVLNATNLWNVRFDKPFNEIFNILSTMGISGLLAALFFGSRVVKLIKQQKEEEKVQNDFESLVNIGIIMSLGFMFLAYSTTLTAFVFFTLLGIKVAIANGANKDELTLNVMQSISSISTFTTLGNKVKINKEYYHIVASSAFVALSFVGGFLMYRQYMGEFFMRKSIESAAANDGSKTYDYQAQAISYNPRRDTYQNAYAQTNLALASVLSSKKDLTDNDKQAIQTLVGQAIRSSRISTELLVPTNVSGWEVRANLYKSIIGMANDAEKWTISAYENAIALDPTNPRLRLDIGGMYFSKGDYITAAGYFRQAITLKNDYANAYYNFAMAAEGVKDYDNAKKALEIVKSLINLESSDYKVVTTELDRIKDMKTEIPGNVAGAATTNTTPKTAGTNSGTLQQLFPTPAKDKTGQEPLKNAADTGAKVVESTASKK